MGRRTALGLMTAILCLGGWTLQAGVKKDIENVKHALGWDTINLTVVEKDAAGRPTLEREINAANRVERKTSYFPNSKKASQTVTVVAKTTDKTLYTEKQDWNDDGTRKYSLVEDDNFIGKGKQTKGQILEKEFQNGNLTMELKKKYSHKKDNWDVTEKQTVSYYENGDMKERITETSPPEKKIRETWSEKKGTLGRKKTTHKWSTSKGEWR
jgi:hypothetical protein